jgi:hypothetical protein
MIGGPLTRITSSSLWQPTKQLVPQVAGLTQRVRVAEVQHIEAAVDPDAHDARLLLWDGAVTIHLELILRVVGVEVDVFL